MERRHVTYEEYEAYCYATGDMPDSKEVVRMAAELVDQDLNLDLEEARYHIEEGIEQLDAAKDAVEEAMAKFEQALREMGDS